MNIEQFGQTIKQKYPQYQDMNDAELGQKMLTKYPQYQDMITVDAPKTSEGFIGGIKSDIQARGQALKPAIEQAGGNFANAPELALNIAGQTAGAVTDIAGRGISALTPNFIKKPLAEGIQKVAETKPIKSATELYGQFKSVHPRAARNIEAAGNVASVLPFGEAGKVEQTAKNIASPLGKVSTALEESAKASEQVTKESFVRDLIRPEQSKAVKEAQVTRTTETGKGILKRSIIAPTSSELKAEKAVLEIPGIKPDGTLQQNYNIIKKANRTKAEELKSTIATNDFIIPKKEIKSRLLVAAETLKASPTITGDAEQTAIKLLNKANQLVDENTGTGSGLLKARKEYDTWVQSQKPNAFDAKAENAFTIANREIRKTFNTLLDEKVPNLKIKESLSKQSALFDAMENIAPKAAYEADTAIVRLLQKAGEVLGTKNRIVQSIAAAVGIGGLGAAATFAPAAAGIGIGGYVLYRGGKFIISPTVKMGLSELLSQLEKQLPDVADRMVRYQMGIDVATVKSILKNSQEEGNQEKPAKNPSQIK